MKKEQVVDASRSVPRGHWTTYQEVGEAVYRHRQAAQSVGNVLRDYGRADSAHRVLLADGKVSPRWTGDGGGPEECIRRLRAESAWDEGRRRARSDRFVRADALRQ